LETAISAQVRSKAASSVSDQNDEGQRDAGAEEEGHLMAAITVRTGRRDASKRRRPAW